MSITQSVTQKKVATIPNTGTHRFHDEIKKSKKSLEIPLTWFRKLYRSKEIFRIPNAKNKNATIAT